MKTTLLALIALTMTSAAATILGTDPDQQLNGALLDGTVTDDQSSFSQEILTIGNETVLGDPVLISSIPLETRMGITHFRLLYDQQETGQSGAHHVAITQLDFLVSSSSVETLTSIATATKIWEAGETIHMNPTDGLSDSPQGNGADLAVLFPVSLASGFSTNDYLYVLTSQEDSDNGFDEWVLGGGPTLDPDTIIGQPVPEPSSFALLGLSVCALILRRRR